MSVAGACAELGIGGTTFKKMCRKEGINRWPYRKFNSIDTLLADLRLMVSRGTQVQTLVQVQQMINRLEIHRDQLLEDPNMELDRVLTLETLKLTGIKHRKRPPAINRHPVNSRGQPVTVEKRRPKHSKMIASRQAKASKNEIEAYAFILLSFKEN